jgi:hypothetical protein
MQQFADLAAHKRELEALLTQHASSPVQLLVVPDVQDWVRNNAPHLPSSRWGMALKDQSTGAAAIVLRQHFTEEQAGSVAGRVAFSGVANALELLGTPRQFARHLLLHELAHLENGWGQEREAECDLWAAERLSVGA